MSIHKSTEARLAPSQFIESYSQKISDPGRIPISIHGLGLFYRKFFETDSVTFQGITQAHQFQSLTESTKPGVAHRSGIYLSPVIQQGDELHFHLLRCSTNLSGPTENFCELDWSIVKALNDEARQIFQDAAPLNHVLAQIYLNTPASPGQKQSKARISSHADKTKDMPTNGIMAFCTFYDDISKLSPLPEDPYDYGHKNISGLTRLQFRLKESVPEADRNDLPEQFSITLYPGSVFFMPLSTNRLYTHEIRSPALDADKIPTRLGYVARCSKTQAISKNGQTWLNQNGTLIRLAEPSTDKMSELRRLYAEENRSHQPIDYGEELDFSMNSGDYRAPHL